MAEGEPKRNASRWFRPQQLFLNFSRRLYLRPGAVKFPVGVGTKTLGTGLIWLATKKVFSKKPASMSSRCFCVARRWRCRRWLASRFS